MTQSNVAPLQPLPGPRAPGSSGSTSSAAAANGFQHPPSAPSSNGSRLPSSAVPGNGARPPAPQQQPGPAPSPARAGAGPNQVRDVEIASRLVTAVRALNEAMDAAAKAGLILEPSFSTASNRFDDLGVNVQSFVATVKVYRKLC